MNDLLSGIVGIAIGAWMLKSGITGIREKGNLPIAYKILSVGQIICGGFGILFIVAYFLVIKPMRGG